MKKTTLCSLASAIAGLLLLPSCVFNHGDFTVLSNKSVRISEFGMKDADRVDGVVGKDVQEIFFIFPTIRNPSMEYAIDRALDEGNGDFLTNANVKVWSWYIPYIYGQSGWTVSGDAISTRRN